MPANEAVMFPETTERLLQISKGKANIDNHTSQSKMEKAIALLWWLKEAIAPTLSYNRVIALSPPTMR